MVYNFNVYFLNVHLYYLFSYFWSILANLLVLVRRHSLRQPRRHRQLGRRRHFRRSLRRHRPPLVRSLRRPGLRKRPPEGWLYRKWKKNKWQKDLGTNRRPRLIEISRHSHDKVHESAKSTCFESVEIVVWSWILYLARRKSLFSKMGLANVSIWPSITSGHLTNLDLLLICAWIRFYTQGLWSMNTILD